MQQKKKVVGKKEQKTKTRKKEPKSKAKITKKTDDAELKKCKKGDLWYNSLQNSTEKPKNFGEEGGKEENNLIIKMKK